MVLKFEFTEQEAQAILNALVKEPYVQVADLVNKVRQQAEKQYAEQKAE